MTLIKYSVSSVITFIMGALINFLLMPAWNLKSAGFWCFILFLVFCFVGILSLFDSLSDECYELPRSSVVIWIGLAIAVVAFLVFVFAGSRFFNAYRYQKMMTVSDADFATDMAEENINSIALMDSASAQIYGQRTLGDLVDVVSQYNVSNTYSQIALNSVPMKVAPLEHNGLIKACNNAEAGIPGYVKINPVTNNAEFVRIEDGAIVYSPSAVFSRDLTRHIRKEFRSTILGESYFEIDEEGNPYWITQVFDHTIGLFGGKVIKGVIITDAKTGVNQYYKTGDVPEWVDIVFDGYYICEKYDDFGLYQNGFWNAVFGQKGCKKTTEDFGYKVIGNDVYIYTGVTSVTSDESNVGFILVNSRTMETKYYPVVGAEEFSAMGAAEGEVQQFGYKASFPSLINVNGQPTYIMVLKDDNGLVKKIAMVNVEKYDIVAVADTQTQVASQYKKLLSSKNVVSRGEVDDEKTVNTTIDSIEYVVVDGATVIYIKTDKGVFKSEFVESYMLLNEQDKVSISYFETGADIEYIEVIK